MRSPGWKNKWSCIIAVNEENGAAVDDMLLLFAASKIYATLAAGASCTNAGCFDRHETPSIVRVFFLGGDHEGINSYLCTL